MIFLEPVSKRRQSLSLVVRAVQVHGLAHAVLVGESDDGTALGLPAVGVAREAEICDRAALFEGLSHVVLVGGEGEVGNEDGESVRHLDTQQAKAPTG